MLAGYIEVAGKETEQLRGLLQGILACGGAAAQGSDCTSAALGAGGAVLLNYLLQTDAEGMSAQEKQDRLNLVNSIIGGVTEALGGDSNAAVIAAKVEQENNQFGRLNIVGGNKIPRDEATPGEMIHGKGCQSETGYCVVENAYPDEDPHGIIDRYEWYQVREITSEEYMNLVSQGRLMPRNAEEWAILGNALYDQGVGSPTVQGTIEALLIGSGVIDHKIRGDISDEERQEILFQGLLNAGAGAAWAKAALAKPAVSTGGSSSNPSGSGANKPFENLYPQDVPRPANVIPNNGLGNITQKNLAYVVLEDGTLVVGRNNANQGHIDLAQGKPVMAAGRVDIVNGEIVLINNWSGHYQPMGSAAQKAAENAFRELGFNVDGKYRELSF